MSFPNIQIDVLTYVYPVDILTVHGVDYDDNKYLKLWEKDHQCTSNLRPCSCEYSFKSMTWSMRYFSFGQSHSYINKLILCSLGWLLHFTMLKSCMHLVRIMQFRILKEEVLHIWYTYPGNFKAPSKYCGHSSDYMVQFYHQHQNTIFISLPHKSDTHLSIQSRSLYLLWRGNEYSINCSFSLMARAWFRWLWNYPETLAS